MGSRRENGANRTELCEFCETTGRELGSNLLFSAIITLNDAAPLHLKRLIEKYRRMARTWLSSVSEISQSEVHHALTLHPRH